MTEQLRNRYELLEHRFDDKVEQVRCARNLAVQQGTEKEALCLEYVARYWETFRDVTAAILAGKVKPVAQ